MESRVPFIRPSFPSAEDVAEDYRSIVESNWFTNFGRYEQLFRKQVGEYIGNDVDVCTTANATLALDVAISSLIRKTTTEHRVLTQSFTFAAGPERLVANGFTPVFLDIDTNLQPNIKQAEQFLKGNRSTTAGLLICNTFGVGNPNITEWEELAGKYELPLIIDSAAGLGSSYNENEKIGARGDCEIFSLHATKPFAVGEGGLITSRDHDLIDTLRSYTNFGFGKDRAIEYIGTNAKLQELNCAIGLRQLSGFPDRLMSRQETLAEYKRGLQTDYFEFQTNDDRSTVAFASIVSPSEHNARAIFDALHNSGVEARRYYAPLHLQKNLAKVCEVAHTLDVTEDIASRIISLPVHDNMSRDMIDYVIRRTSI